MARIQIPLDALTSRLNLGSRLEGVKSQSLSTRFANLRPISEFLNLSRLSKPASFGEVQSRVNYNLGLLTNLTLLFDIIFVGLGLFGIKKLDGRDLELGFARATTPQLYTGLFVVAVPLFIWANPIGSALWLVGATGAGTRRKPQERYFEELDSDDDDGQGVTLDENYFSDELNFTGTDLGPYTRNRRKHGQGYDSHSSEEDETFDESSNSMMQVALRNKEDLLLKQALSRIRRAQMLGQRNVKLTQPEIDALERKRRQDEAGRSRIVSGSKQVDKRRSSNQLQLIGKDSTTSKNKNTGLSPTFERSLAAERRGDTPRGSIAPGSDGRPIYSPSEHYPPTTKKPSSSRNSRSGSLAGSAPNYQQSTPPLPSSQFWSGQPRYSSEPNYPSPLPASQMMRRLPDDPHWNPRPRSASSNHQYPSDPYQQPFPSPSPSHPSHYGQGRRIVSGPAEVQYHGIVRRPVPMSSIYATSSDPALPRRAPRREQGQDDDISAGETEDEDGDYGVQVDNWPNENGYEMRNGRQLRPDPRSRRSLR
ncbi:MAG: hypothetical protein Q9219_000003 [cf. Caloplaca sp. 3 TL-2023]